ncbi:uncharacterized protein LOC127838438 isoform X2 [Dreissena polymorpha]|nr:uncharacterized protein LOC127838438 isoform X2 [Dreissena polymorpha]
MYVPVNVLKHLERRIYGIMRFFVSAISRPGISADGKHFNAFKESAVGLEFAELDGTSTMVALNMPEFPDTRIKNWGVVLKVVHNLLDSFDAMVHKCYPHEFCNSQSQKTFSNLEESVTSAAKKLADMFRDDGNDDKDTLKMRHEIKEPKTDPIYRKSLSNEIGETTELPKLMTADMVPAFTIQGWPRVAEEWITRHRKWPSNNLVLNIVQTGCQIVAKRPLYPTLNGDRNNEDHSQEVDENDTCFRLSFSQCELALAKQLSEVPLLCWKILKAYQKAFLRTEPPVLTSYHWKTVLFWIREDTDDDFWSEPNMMNCVIKALDFMINCLKDRFLPLFFVRGENLIAGCRDDLVDITLEKVIEIRKAPRKYLNTVLENPPKPEVYIISKDKIKEYLSAESNNNMVEDICNNMLHDFWYSMPWDITNNADECSKDRYDSIMRRLPNNLRNWLQLMKGECMTKSAQLIFTGMESLMETVFTFNEHRDSANSDSENEQVIYSRKQTNIHTPLQESQMWDVPSNANVQNDQTKTNDSFTVKANEQPRTNEDMANDKGTSTVAEPSDNSRSTVKVDVKLNGYPQKVLDTADYQKTNEETSKKSTKQKDDSFSRTVEVGFELLNDLIRLSEEEEEENQESDKGKRESGSGLIRVAGNCACNLIQSMKEESKTHSEQLILTGFGSLMETVCTIPKEKDSKKSDSEKEQVIYSREKTSKNTKDIPSKENVHNDQTRNANDSFTVQSNEHPRTTEDMADDKASCAVASSKSTEPSNTFLSTVKVDVELGEYPKQVNEKADKQSTNAEISNKSTKQKANSCSRKINAGLTLLNDFVRLVSEKDQESDEGERASGSGFVRFAGKIIRDFQQQLGEDTDNNNANMTNSSNTNRSSKAPCDFDLD